VNGDQLIPGNKKLNSRREAARRSMSLENLLSCHRSTDHVRLTILSAIVTIAPPCTSYLTLSNIVTL